MLATAADAFAIGPSRATSAAPRAMAALGLGAPLATGAAPLAMATLGQGAPLVAAQTAPATHVTGLSLLARRAGLAAPAGAVAAPILTATVPPTR